jgi:hypothetical protein
MTAPNVDLALVVDTSQSMKNCFDQLRQHLGALLTPMQGNVSKVRYSLVGLSASKSSEGGVTYLVNFLHGPWDFKLYERSPNDPDPRNEYFTDNADDLKQALARLDPSGDEDMLLALDIAADLPFGPVSNTKRVIALFSDESFERGVSGNESNAMIPSLREKLMARHIQLFAAVPEGKGANDLAETDRSEVEFIDGGGGLKSVDFSRLLAQMGKSISGSSLQSVSEPPYQRALFGQDKWAQGTGWSSTDGG